MTNTIYKAKIQMKIFMSLRVSPAIYQAKTQTRIFMSLTMSTAIYKDKMQKEIFMSLAMNQDMSAAKSMKFYTRRKFLTMTTRWTTVI